MTHTKRRLTRSLGLFMAIALVAAACSSDDDGSADTTAAATTTEASTETTAAPAATTTAAPAEEMALISDECPIPEPAEAVSIDLLGVEFPATAQYGEEFEECNTDNLTVNVQFLDTDGAQAQRDLDLATGSPELEILQLTNSTVGGHAEDLLDLTPFVEKYRDEFDLDDIGAGFWATGTIDGKILGIPVLANTLHFFYNTEILAANGVTPPTTFPELIEACGVLKDAGFDNPFNMNLSAGWSSDMEFFGVTSTVGGGYLNSDNTPGFNTDEGVAAVNEILAVRDACMSAAGRAFSIDDTQAALQAGELPMAHIWASRAAAMDDAENSLVVGVIEFAPSLYTEAGSLRDGIAFTDVYSIPKNTSVDPEIIFQVIMAGTDLESQNAVAAFAAVSRASASNADGPRNNAVLSLSVAEGVGPQPAVVARPILSTALGDELVLVFQNDADVATALATAEANYIAEATAAGLIK
jgi:multiple sugar transport system substrate-binding protein